MSRKRGCFIAFVIGLLLLGLFVFLQIPATQFRGLPRDAGTTVISEPVKADGSIDYLKYLNNYLSEGVTPDNNAVVLLVQVLGLEMGELEGPFYEKFGEMLGAPGFQHDPKLIDPVRWLQDQVTAGELRNDDVHPLIEEQELLGSKPWQDADHPQFAAALEQQHEALDLIVEASRRPRFYHPLVIMPDSEEGMNILMSALLPLSQQCRHAARQLRFRAMNSIGKGDVDAAIEDIKAMRRLGILTSQSLTMIERLVSLAVHDMGCAAEQELLASGLMSREQLDDYREFIAAWPVNSDLAKRVDLAERFMCLDVLQNASVHGGNAILYGLQGSGLDSNDWQMMVLNLVLSSTDMGQAMRTSNQWYDKGVESLQLTSPRERYEACNELFEEVEALEVELVDPASAVWTLLSSPKARGKMVGKFMVATFFPGLQQVNNLEFRMQLKSQLMEVACLIEAYRKEIGSYPSSLQELEEQFGSAELLNDPLNDQQLNYQTTDTGYLLFSIGVDGEDNGGREWLETSDSSKFDIRVCIGDPPEPEEDSPIAREAQARASELRWQERQRRKAESARGNQQRDTQE
ncbi:MAG: hypothetical protein ACR2NP_23070 [Pirellulaceae bacterium]